ncbi:helix-turn-helix transcriptional regulator [Micromonospora tulbaghiae]|uniref:helix-turn-helix transcriptional regulator n=1 Tax=Micromonospora tulbaghiae TaxID=479978 RepID=UPI003EBD677C
MADDDVSERWQQELRMAPPFAEAFGARLREVREHGELRLTTDQVAGLARGLGLPWHRTTVGQIERGKRTITAVELLLLPQIYGAPLQELLPQETTWLTDQTAVSHEVLWLYMTMTGDQFRAPGSWGLFQDGPGRWSTELGRRTAGMSVDDLAAMVNVVQAAVDGQWPSGARPEHRATPDEAESKAAARLDTTAQYVAYAARVTWGRGLSEERDRRLGERGPVPTDKRALQAARGHVTRALLKELEPVVRELEQQRDAPEEPIKPGSMKMRFGDGPWIPYEGGEDASR